jgi:hypothetical protein
MTEWTLKRKGDDGEITEFDIREMSIDVDDGIYYGTFRATQKSNLIQVVGWRNDVNAVNLINLG